MGLSWIECAVFHFLVTLESRVLSSTCILNSLESGVDLEGLQACACESDCL
jgi:hypothetical protein